MLEASITAVDEAKLNIEVDEAIANPLELEASITLVVEAVLNRKLDEVIVVPFEPPNGVLLQPVAWATS